MMSDGSQRVPTPQGNPQKRWDASGTIGCLQIGHLGFWFISLCNFHYNGIVTVFFDFLSLCRSYPE